MNTDNLILRETDNLPLINKDDTLTSADLDGNFIKIYNDFLALSTANDPTLVFDIDRSYAIGEYATYNGKMWVSTIEVTGVTPDIDSLEWLDIFPTVLAHEKNKDTYLDYGGANATSVAEIRAFIDAGLTSTTNLTLTTKTGTSFKIESSTGSDVIIPQATVVDAGLLNAEDKVKLNNTSGINTGDQTLASLNAEDVDNKVTDFTTINDTLYPTTQAVDTYITAQVPDLVETFLDSNVEVTTNKATDFTTVNDTKYPTVKAVDDHINSKLAGLWDDRGSYDASTNLFPSTGGSGGSGAIMKGDIWTINVQGTLGGTVMHVGDTVRALTDAPGQTSTNWALLENAIGYVPENVINKVTTFVGNTTSDTKYPSVKAIVDNFDSTNIKSILGVTVLSGSNTGDQDLSGLMVKSNNLSDLTNTTTARTNLGLGTLATQSGTFSGTSSGTNTGDQIISDATLTTSDITTNNVSTTKHGFVPKAPNNTTQFLRGDGTWGTPASGGLTYFTEAQNTTAPNATVPVDSLTAVTGTTNGDFAIIPKGSGAIVTAIPDSGVVNGNKRGAYAVDLCLYRTSSNQVSAGAYSGLFAGQRNFLGSGQTNCTIIGGNQTNLYGGTDSAMISCSGGELSGSNNVTIGGTSSNNFGQNCLVTGNSNSSSGTSNTVTGVGNNGGGTANLLSGSNNTSSGTNSFLSGKLNVSSGKYNLLGGQWGNDFGHVSRFIIGTFQDTGPYTKGISQLSTLATTYVSTTNTAVELVSFDGTAIALILQDNNAMRIKGSIIGKQTGSTNVSCYDFDCVIVRGVGVATTVLKVNNMNLVFDDIVCTVLPTLTANTTLGGLSIKSGAKTTTNIRWVARIDSTESILA